MTIVEALPGITGGVDTHLEVHVAAALDPLCRLLDLKSFAADAGYRELLEWLCGFDDVTKVGVEGTGSPGRRRRDGDTVLGDPGARCPRIADAWRPEHG